MTQHSPAPFQNISNTWILDADHVTIAVLHGTEKNGGTSRSKRAANAVLFAHAPALLSELETMTQLFQSALLCTNPEIAKEGMEYVRRARALIVNVRQA